ncbi:hypothetical protein B0H16DRAFT_1696966 [Mycena metata]|uniref:Uncharacterized protein n=1 Tax=Mycena metata TaxID=1033252 RepID=A0AAD7HWZ5_9AGAR|nr:hypothetical protein B0H16DRAFT_1696966 [Mycena metata]
MQNRDRVVSFLSFWILALLSPLELAIGDALGSLGEACWFCSRSGSKAGIFSLFGCNAAQNWSVRCVESTGRNGLGVQRSLLATKNHATSTLAPTSHAMLLQSQRSSSYINARDRAFLPSNAHALHPASISSATGGSTPNELMQEEKVEGAMGANEQIYISARTTRRPFTLAGNVALNNSQTRYISIARYEQRLDTPSCASVWIWAVRVRAPATSRTKQFIQRKEIRPPPWCHHPSPAPREGTTSQATQTREIIHVARWRTLSTRTIGMLMWMGNTTWKRWMERSKGEEEDPGAQSNGECGPPCGPGGGTSLCGAASHHYLVVSAAGASTVHGRSGYSSSCPDPSASAAPSKDDHMRRGVLLTLTDLDGPWYSALNVRQPLWRAGRECEWAKIQSARTLSPFFLHCLRPTSMTTTFSTAPRIHRKRAGQRTSSFIYSPLSFYYFLRFVAGGACRVMYVALGVSMRCARSVRAAQ